MKKFKRKVLIFLLFILFFVPLFSSASENKEDFIFPAEVLEIVEEKKVESSLDNSIIQQDVKLVGLDEEFNEEVFFYGIGGPELVDHKVYEEGEKVLVAASFNYSEEEYNYYIIDRVRSNSLIFIIGLFFLILLLVAGWKGFRSILSLILSFVVIILFIVPQIMAGFNPVVTTIIGALFILLLIIYLTEGINLRAHISVLSALISLVLVLLTSSFFIYLTKLSGFYSEDVLALVYMGESINFKGILLAGIIIGALGVLNDVIVSQVASVEQIIDSNPGQKKKEVFRRAHKIGVSHISSMTNTLFLAYAGVSIPLLVLFISPEGPFNSFQEIINNEMISTEIVRALSGSLGIILAVPMSTFIAVWGFSWKKKNE
jgi:uncharacterized membrane protein